MKYFRLVFLLILLAGPVSADTMGQFFKEDTVSTYDPAYIKFYRDELTTRFFISRKQTGLDLSHKLLKPWLNYKTNDMLQLGLGYTYSFLTINLGVKMPFVNRDDEQYGTSRLIDLQAHTIFRVYIVDLYLQWAKGYYMANPESIYRPARNGGGFPIRGDMRTSILGLNVQYLFNSSRYSYKAAFQQNQFQKKSAGSPLAGVEGYWVLGMTDSAMVAGDVPPSGFLDDDPFNRVDLVNVGINGGYAYTFVWQEKLFLSLSAIVGIAGGYNQVHYSNNSVTLRDGLTAGLSSSLSIALGYNSNDYYVGVSFVRMAMNNLAWGYGDWFTYSTGHFRLNFVKRFQLKRPIKILRPDLWIL